MRGLCLSLSLYVCVCVCVCVCVYTYILAFCATERTLPGHDARVR